MRLLQFAITDFLIAVGIAACLVDAVRRFSLRPVEDIEGIANSLTLAAELVAATLAFFFVYARWFRRVTGQDF